MDRELTVDEKKEIANKVYTFVVNLEKENVKSNEKILITEKVTKISNYFEGVYNEYEIKKDDNK